MKELDAPENIGTRCSDCLASLESSEHHAKCLSQRVDCDGYCMVPFGQHHPRCGVRRQ